MAKGKPKQATKDQHASGFMVRLPESAKAMLEEMKESRRRPFTTELLIALEQHYAAFKAANAGGAK